MKITRVETLRHPDGASVNWGDIPRRQSQIQDRATAEWAGVLWVRVHTDTGLVGTGETYPCPEVEEAVVHARLAPQIVGENPLEIERLHRAMFEAVSWTGWAGAEMRAISAVDMALWDLFGKQCQLPIYQLLGGKVRDRIPTYNTCYDEFDQHTDAGKLARSLLDSGIKGMKIWPFDKAGKETGGNYITAAHMEEGLSPVRKIREEVGRDMDIMMEFHGFWNLSCAEKIAHALEPYDVAWLEDMMLHEKLSAYASLRQRVRQPIVASERVMGRWGFSDLLDMDAVGIAMFDVSWCGGLTEARKIAIMADVKHVSVTPHNCGGPLLHLANLHLGAHVSNLVTVESVRKLYNHTFPRIVTAVPSPTEGSPFIELPDGPGLGADLRPEFVQACNSRSSTIAYGRDASS